MKRDKAGKFAQSWSGESKQSVKLSLTHTAWQLLERQAGELGISRSELVERYARSHQKPCCQENSMPPVAISESLPSEASLVEQIAVLRQHNRHLQNQIAECQQRMDELQSQEQRFQRMVDAIPHMVWVCRSNGEVEYFNQQSLDAFGITLEQLLAEGWHPLVHPDDLQRTVDAWSASVTTGTPYQLEYRLKLADGSYRWYLAQALPDRDASGHITRWFGTCTEIEASKQLEQKLQQQADAQMNERQWLEAVLNLLPTPLILVDPEQCRVTFSNRAANAIAGVDLVKDVGTTYNEDYHCKDAAGQVIPPEQLPAVQAAQGEKIVGAEISWHTPAGVFPLLVHTDLLPAMHDRSATSIVVFQNISERKRIEEQLKESQRFIKQVADATPGILYIYDLIEQHNVYINRQIGEVLGYTPDAVRAMGNTLFLTLMHPEDLASLPAHIERFDRAQDGEVIEREYRMRHANGEWRWLWSRDLVFSRTETGVPRQVLGISHDITDRKQAELVSTQLYQAEQAARTQAEASEQRFRFLAESIPQMVWVAQADGFTEYYNQRWFQYTGLTLEESQNAKGSFRHPDDHDRFGKAWVKAVTNKETFQSEQRIRRADGSYRWHLTRAFPLLDEKGEILKWFGSCTDIDDWKRMEQTQRFLAQASQTFVAASLDLPTILDTVTRLASELTQDVCVLNLLSGDRHAFNHVSFYHPDPEIRAFVGDLLERHPHCIDAELGERVMQTGESLLIPVTSQADAATIKSEYRLYLEQFQVRSVLLVPLKVQGQPMGVLSLTRHAPADPHTQDDLNLFQDLADRATMAIANAKLYQQAEQARQQAERTADRTARLQAVTAALSESLTPVQVAEVIAQQTSAVVNAASVMVALLTPKKDELEVIHFLGYDAEIAPEWRRFSLTVATPLTDAIRTGQPMWEETLEERITRYPHLANVYARAPYPAWISLPLMVEGQAVGGITVTFAQSPQLKPDDRAFMLSLAQQCAQAIARAQLYEAEQQARAQAEAANRTKDEFLAVLSHELRTPMNPILGWARLLQQGNLDAERTAIALETIERNAKLQAQLIEDLLDVSRILQGKLRLNISPVSPVATIAAALETVRLSAEAKGIEIQTVLDSKTGWINGDASRLQQIVWNLLSNAVKFTPSGGRVEVRLEQVGTCIQIQVSDTGQGINPDFLPHVFEYFRQADSSTTRRFGGLGLGLAIVRHLVELHGGMVRVESPGEGLGATFTIRLPILTTQRDASTDIQPSLVSPDLSGMQILVVDDDPDTRKYIAFMLEQAGATVSIAASATEALMKLTQSKPDLLLSDIGMPGMNGYMLIRQVRALPLERGGNIPAIALTAYAGDCDQQQALEAGFQHHVAKPVEPDQLLKLIADLTRVDLSRV
ncbi:PAS domain-containing protein [Oscillatoria sp. FACHB-1407]|uniref:PAS domain-containing protein n=1 Tax=Oscillatoria sp. FACHB-1407 TaxID=2692847 RepID=UPI001687E9B9|nr:PAS domain-containing protein [Oscillatoria sp. FACHB-1407]MBD2463204.1 PAS domain-containing protein [Oscillatoria sp. FACHB-1407]